MKKPLLALVMWFALTGVAMAAVNINTATKEDLTSINGVGEKRAQEIIDYRKKNGNFKSVDDLEKVPGIGPGLMKRIRSQVTVTGKTSIDKPTDKDTKGKGTEAKTAEAPKGDAMKSDTAKTKVAEKSKADEKKAAEKK
jgi:competence protein ComEA